MKYSIRSYVRYSAMLSLLVHGTQYGSIIVQGDEQAAQGTTFSFPVKAHVGSSNGNIFFVGALSANQGKNFSLSQITRDQASFTPITPELITLNGQQGQVNPLYNAGIQYLDIVSTDNTFGGSVDRPVAVSTLSPSTIYLFERSTNPLSLVSASHIKDAQGQITAGIVAIAGTRWGRAGVFAAVKKNGGEFGDVGGGIALAQLTEVLVVDGKIVGTVISNGRIISNTDGKILDIDKIESKNKEKPDKQKQMLFFQFNSIAPQMPFAQATPLDITSSSLKIHNNLVSISNVVSMYWDINLQRLYIALQAQGNNGESDGLKAIVVGAVDNQGAIIFYPFVPDTIFTPNAHNEIIGAIGANAQVSLHQIKPLRISTGLDYLIVLGSNGDPSTTRNRVFALPITNYSNQFNILPSKRTAQQGTLANKNATPKEIFSTGRFSLLQRRVITNQATTPNDIFTTQVDGDGVPTLANRPAHVGSGALLAGNIDECIVYGDTVFAVVNTPAVGFNPGVFYSQALLGADGKIQAWTAWQRVAGTTNPVLGTFYDGLQGNFTLMKGVDASHITTIERTTWGQGNEAGLSSLGSLISTQFPLSNGGLQGLVELPYNSPGLLDISMIIATGLGKIALVETGHVVGGVFIPLTETDFSNLVHFTDGTITANVNAPVVTITGGELNTIGPVVAAEIGINGTAPGSQGFLFVGGAHGLAVLTDALGNGWDSTTQLASNFTGLVSGMSFKKIGNYSFVRKLIYDNNFLYVLTNTSIDRLDLTMAGFPATTVATNISLPGVGKHGTLYDLLVSDAFALVATSMGLLRVANGSSIAQALSPEGIEWSSVPVAQSTGSITQLIGISATGFARDVARFQGGNIDVLNAYQGQPQAQLNRYTVAALDGGSVTNTTLQPLPDIVFQHSPTAYSQYQNFQSMVATDGALYLEGLNQNIPGKLALQSGTRRVNFSSIPTDALDNASIFVRMVRNSPTGSWLVATDAGLLINE